MDYLLKINSIQNPNKLPLNELNLEYKNFSKAKKLDKNEDLEEAARNNLKRNYDVRIEKIPALDEKWLELNHPFYFYQPYFPEVSEADNELFFNKNKQFLDGVDFLLRCSYQQFWCYVTCDPIVSRVIKSFIYNALPWYEVKSLSEEAFKLYSKIHDKMLLLLCKLFTYKQSEVEYMHENTILKLLEKSNLLSFTMMARLCLLYKHSDQYFIKKLLKIFRKNKIAYEDDCKKFIEQAVTVFEMIGGHISGFDQTAVIVPLSIGPKPAQFDPYWYADAMLLLADTVSNLNAFLVAAGDQIETAMELELPKSLTFFYNQVFPRLYKTLNSQRGVAFDWSNLKDRILEIIAVARSEFINCFDMFVQKFIHDAIHTQNPQEKDEHLENYITLISSAMDEEYFIADYHNAINIDVQLQYICDFYPEHDKMRTNYLIQCLSTLPKLEPLQNIETRIENPIASGSYTSVPSENKIKLPEKPLEEEIEGKILLIQDTLPDHGDGFILKCLEAYNYDTESVISAILDNNLPPHIECEPIGLIRIPPEPEPEQPILAYRGKKPTKKDTNELLNDKSDMKEIKNFILKTSANTYDMYDDDYDDRYDYEAPTRPSEEKDDPYKYMENRFEGYDLVSDPSESSSDEEAPQKVKEKSKNFCEDPALIRQQREKKFANKDVVGKPKGQGQEKVVLKNRHKKEVNKSSRANHNRKGGAQWKRNKGMLPS